MNILSSVRAVSLMQRQWADRSVSLDRDKSKFVVRSDLVKIYGASKKLIPSSGQVDGESATETVNLGSIPGWVKPKTIKLIFTAFLPDVQQQQGQCEASPVCGGQVAA